MTHFRPSALAVSAIALFAAGAAQAQVTAADVWASWQQNLSIYGTEGVTIGSEQMTGNVLTVGPITFDMTDDLGGTVKGSIDALTFTENGDGTVGVTMPASMPYTITSPNPDGSTATIVLAINQTGMVLTASGTPDAISYAISAPRYGLDLVSIDPGTGPIAASGSLAFINTAGEYRTTSGEVQNVAYQLSADSVEIVADVNDPASGTVVKLNGALNALATRGAMAMPVNSTPEMLMADGMSVQAAYSSGGGSFTLSMVAEGLPVDATITSGPAESQVGVSAESMLFSSLTQGLSINATSPAMPFPVNVSLAQYGFNMEMPMSQTEAPAPFAAGINLTELSVNDEIWAMIDPAAILPRDPATAVLSMTGTAKMLFDLTDPNAQMEMQMSGAAPGELHSLSLDALNLSIGGASVTGTGAFTFDNADLVTFGGIPKPTGQASFAMSGINGLIDNLVMMGLVPEEQVMGARMMMGMFTVTTGDDQMTTSVEVNAEGHLIVNGQRLQ